MTPTYFGEGVQSVGSLQEKLAGDAEKYHGKRLAPLFFWFVFPNRLDVKFPTTATSTLCTRSQSSMTPTTTPMSLSSVSTILLHGGSVTLSDLTSRR